MIFKAKAEIVKVTEVEVAEVEASETAKIYKLGQTMFSEEYFTLPCAGHWPLVFKNKKEFLKATECYKDIGHILQGQGGNYWAWPAYSIIGNLFSTKAEAMSYLDAVNSRR